MADRQTLTPSLNYDDPAAAIAWLERVFGFEPSMHIEDKDGNLVHAEMRAFGATLMLGPAGWMETARSPASLQGANTQRLHVEVPDANAQYERVIREGGSVWKEPEDQFYGARTFGAVDLEGHMWTFSTHMREVSVEDMEAASGLTFVDS